MPKALASSAREPKWLIASSVRMPGIIGIPKSEGNRHADYLFLSKRENADMDSIGQRIKALRESRRLSGAALARLIGIKQPSLWELENQAGAEPSGRVLARLCLHLHTTPEYIMEGASGSEGLEIEMQAAEILFAFRHTDESGRYAMLATARGLMATAPKGISRPFAASSPQSPAAQSSAPARRTSKAQ